jgi:hypothetical protein
MSITGFEKAGVNWKVSLLLRPITFYLRTLLSVAKFVEEHFDFGR